MCPYQVCRWHQTGRWTRHYTRGQESQQGDLGRLDEGAGAMGCPQWDILCLARKNS